MDAADRRILSALQEDGRLTLTELAERVGLSLSPCHRRVRALEQRGVIRGYSAAVDPALVGLTFASIVFVTLREFNAVSVAAFEDAVPAIPEIITAQRLFGDPDYILHVVAKDIGAFQKLYDERLSALPGVLRLRSTLVMREIFQGRALPLQG